MKTILSALLVLLVADLAVAKPMTSSVESWEGVFTLNGTNALMIRINGLPTLRLWRYDLAGGSGGTAIGFSTDDGDMILSPTPEVKGEQPVYLENLVTMTATNKAEILVVYAVQGNGRGKIVEAYEYNGKSIVKIARTVNGGKPDFKWFRETGATQPARGGSLQVKPRPTPQDDKAELKTLIGKVPKDDFAMPLIAGEILPGSIQGCFITADTEECVVALYPKGMARPDRERAIQVNCRMQVLTSTAPSSPNAKIHMRYSQKVAIIDSWEYIK